MVDAADKENDANDGSPQNLIKIDESKQVYVPPSLSGGIDLGQSSKEHQNPLSLTERAMSIVCINQIPVLNVFDLTRRSHN